MRQINAQLNYSTIEFTITIKPLSLIHISFCIRVCMSPFYFPPIKLTFSLKIIFLILLFSASLYPCESDITFCNPLVLVRTAVVSYGGPSARTRQTTFFDKKLAKNLESVTNDILVLSNNISPKISIFCCW